MDDEDETNCWLPCYRNFGRARMKLPVRDQRHGRRRFVELNPMIGKTTAYD